MLYLLSACVVTPSYIRLINRTYNCIHSMHSHSQKARHAPHEKRSAQLATSLHAPLGPCVRHSHACKAQACSQKHELMRPQRYEHLPPKTPKLLKRNCIWSSVRPCGISSRRCTRGALRWRGRCRAEALAIWDQSWRPSCARRSDPDRAPDPSRSRPSHPVWSVAASHQTQRVLEPQIPRDHSSLAAGLVAGHRRRQV